MFGRLSSRVEIAEREIKEVKRTLDGLEDKTNTVTINQGKILASFDTLKWSIGIAIAVATLIQPFIQDLKNNVLNDGNSQEKQIWIMEQRLLELENR